NPPIQHPDFHSGGALSFEQYFGYVHAFVRFDTVLAGILQHHPVEFAAHYLPGLRALVRLVVPEVEWRRQLSAGAHKLHTVLLDEMAAAHLVQHVQTPQHPVCFRDERFADMEAGKVLPFEQLDLKTLLRHEGGNGRAGGSAADHDYIWIRAHTFIIRVKSRWGRRFACRP